MSNDDSDERLQRMIDREDEEEEREEEAADAQTPRRISDISGTNESNASAGAASVASGIDEGSGASGADGSDRNLAEDAGSGSGERDDSSASFGDRPPDERLDDDEEDDDDENDGAAPRPVNDDADENLAVVPVDPDDDDDDDDHDEDEEEELWNESDMDVGEDSDDSDDDRRHQLLEEFRLPHRRNDIMHRMLNAMISTMMGRGRRGIDEDDDEDAESAAASSGAAPRVEYDVELPGAHTYLGNDLEDHSGRTVLEEETFHTIPLHTHTGVVLMPGEVLPLHIHHPHTISMMKNIIRTHRTFGVAHQNVFLRTRKRERAIGVTAEILSSKEEGDDFRLMSLKAMGRQRFEIVETWREATGVQVAKVRMLPEVWFDSPLNGDATAGLDPFLHESGDGAVDGGFEVGVAKRRSPFDENAFDAGAERQGTESVRDPRPSSFRKRLRRRRGGHSLSADMTVWPSWVYSQYEADQVIKAIKSELRCWDSSNKMNTIPQDPVQFSFWVAGNLPVDDSLRLHLLSMDCANQRLRSELAILRKCTRLECRTCSAAITDSREVFSMSKTGPQSAYVNPSGYVFETLTVYKARNLACFGSPNPEYSWFPGYAWTPASCRSCHNQMGWKFTVVEGKKGQLVPPKFFGITRRSIRPSLDSSLFHLEEEDKRTREERTRREEERAKRAEERASRGESEGRGEEDSEEEEEDEERAEKKKRMDDLAKEWLPIM